MERLIVASSMSIYGEGLYEPLTAAFTRTSERSLDQLRRSEWEMRSPDGEALLPSPTPEWKTPSLASVYAFHKYDQERMCLMIGQAYGIPLRGNAFLQRIRPESGVVESVYGRTRDLRLAPAQRQAARDFRGRQATPGFRQRARRRRACRLALEHPAAGGKCSMSAAAASTVSKWRPDGAILGKDIDA